MSDENKEGQESKEQTPAPKIFTKKDIVKFISLSLHLPKVYPGFAPWEFKMRLKLSGQAEERRQSYLALSAMERTAGVDNQMLDEVCDLLIEMPKGFGDLQETGKGPGHSFKSYIETATADEREMLMKIVEGVSNLYWAALMPREFRPTVSDSVS